MRIPPSFKRGMNGPTFFGLGHGKLFLYGKMFIFTSYMMNIYLLTCML
jgi:hypothetical protein